ncbi:MAG: DUF4159 domain-containing protein [Lentisphaerae bacterium]|nr:DUF4159 domain-containing protein [Lentisphaerota bacterium]
MKTRPGISILAAGVLAAGARPGAGQNERWNATPNDVNNLLKEMQQMTGAQYVMEIKTVGELDTNPEHNPVVYYSGHYNFEFTDRERARLREYMLAGGMMVFNTGLGSAPFYRSARRELALIFPEAPLQRLSSDHPIFHAYYDVDRVEYSPGVYETGFKGNEPWMDGVTIACRTLAVISRFGLAVGWDGGEVKPEYAAYMPDSARRLGVNLIAYATAMRAWAKNAAQAMEFVDAERADAGTLALVQVMYDGEWKTRHTGLSVLLQTFNRKTGIPVRFELKELPLTDPGLFNAPLLYMTGHEYFELSEEELVTLRTYLLRGGFLFGEACCGRKGFDRAFRLMLRRVLPGRALTDIPPGGALFQVPNDVRALAVTPLLAADAGRAAIPPRLEGVEIEGHYAVIYSPLGLAGGWEMSQSPYARGYETAGALKLGQNILMYAVTQ